MSVDARPTSMMQGRTFLGSPKMQLALVVLVFILLSALLILQKRPWFDEGSIANVPYNLLNYGHLGMPIWLTQRENWPGTEYYTYYILPVSIVLQAGWFAITGFGLIQMRVLTALFGLLILLSVYYGTRRVSGHHSLALLAALLVGTDYNMTLSSADGRMDIICAGFGFAAISSYLLLREARFGCAVLVSQILVVLSGLTHPAGLLYLTAVIALILYLDRKRVQLHHIALGLAPYVVGLLAWGSYILQNVEVFLGQFFSAFAGRSFQFNELTTLGINRYLSAAFGIGSDIPVLGRFKIFQLVAYWGAVLVYIFHRPLRGEARIQVLALLLLLTVLAMIVFTPGEQLLYLVHILPLYAIMLAAVIWYFLRHMPLFRLPIAAVLAGLIAIQASGPIGKFFVNNEYRDGWMPAIERIEELRKPGDVIVGSSEFGFAFGYEGEVVDDFYLGTRYDYIGDIVVIGRSYNKVYEGMKVNDPKSYNMVVDRLNSMYDQVFDGSEYKIYVLKIRRASSNQSS